MNRPEEIASKNKRSMIVLYINWAFKNLKFKGRILVRLLDFKHKNNGSVAKF